MTFMHNTEESLNEYRHFLSGEGISCLAIFGSAVMTLLVLYELLLIWY